MRTEDRQPRSLSVWPVGEVHSSKSEATVKFCDFVVVVVVDFFFFFLAFLHLPDIFLNKILFLK